MALNENGGIDATMLVGPTGYNNGGYPYAVPVMGGYGNGFGGGFGGDWSGLLVLFLFAAMFGGFGGGFGGMGGFGGYDFPWLLNGQNNISDNVNDGFRDAQLHDSVTSVRDGVSALSTQLCNCCSDMQMSLANTQSAISNQLYNNEIASLNRSFAEQTANAAGFNGVQSSLCDIRYGNAMNTRDVLTALTSGVQSIKDQLCQDKIDEKNDEIAQLRQEVLFARDQASQIAQNSTIIDGIYDRLDTCPVGTTPVYGRTPIFTCNNGCGCNGGF